MPSTSPVRTKRSLTCALVGAAVIAHVTPAHALDYDCLPTAVGVPGQPGPPPWWSAPTDLHDPRWQGAFAFGTQGNDQGEFRGLTYSEAGKTHLVLSFEVKVDPGPVGSTNDFVWLGLSGGGITHVIKLVRSGNATTPAGGSVPVATSVQLKYFNTGTSAYDVVSPTPAWLANDVRVDQSCGGAPATCDTWAFRVRIPLDPAATASAPTNGINIPATGFKLWFEMRANSVDASSVAYVTRHKLPASAADVGGAPEAYPDPSTWVDALVGTTPGAGNACVGGVDLAWNGITVTNTSAANDHQISPVALNTFHARPRNNTTTTYGDSTIQARFRIANWGSVLFSSPEWIDVPAPSVNCNQATGSGAGSVAPGAAFDLTCTWQLTPTQQCTYRPDTFNSCSPMPTPRNRHQCILATLTNAPGSLQPIVFASQSSWRNMDFITASKVTRVADVDIRGLAALPGTTARDVYLYVKTRNMPAQVDPPGGQPEQPRDDQPGAAGRLLDKNLGNVVPGRVGTAEAERLRGALAAGGLTTGQIEAVMPAYTVYAWYDSGQTSDGAKVLTPMPAFGYFVAHDGALTGWKHSLTGEGGAILTPIGPNFYRVPVPNDGVIQVTTTIVALEGFTLPPWLWLLLLLLLIVIVVLRKLRRGTP